MSVLEGPDNFDVSSKRPKIPPLTEEETELAMEKQNISTQSFPMVDRTYSDPEIPFQRIALFSFFPAEGATPNKSGIFGFAKIRGVFDHEVDANTRAEKLIREYDSYNKIYHVYVGKPFPCTVLSDFSGEIRKVNVQKEIAKGMSSFIEKKTEEEKEEVKKMKERKENLVKESQREITDVEKYLSEKTKRCQLISYIKSEEENIQKIRDALKKVEERIEEIDKNKPEIKEQFLEKLRKYKNANSGIVKDLVLEYCPEVLEEN